MTHIEQLDPATTIGCALFVLVVMATGLLLDRYLDRRRREVSYRRDLESILRREGVSYKAGMPLEDLARMAWGAVTQSHVRSMAGRAIGDLARVGDAE